MDPVQIADYARRLVGRLSQSGWRPMFGWGGGAVIVWAYKFAFITAPLQGIALSSDYFNGLNIAAGIFVGAFISRGVEKQAEIRAPAVPGGGLVNNAAIS